MKKRLLARLLVLAMVFQLSGTALASHEEVDIQDTIQATSEESQEQEEISQEIDGGTSITTSSVGNLTISGGTQGTDFSFSSGLLTILQPGTYTISGTSTTERIEVNENVTAVNLIFSNASLDAPDSNHALLINEGAEVNLSGTATLTGTGSGYNGIRNSGTLNITSGTIIAQGTASPAIYNYGDLSISGNSTLVKAQPKAGNTISFALFNMTEAMLNIKGGTVEISGNAGIKNFNSMNISGGNTTITASSGTGLTLEQVSNPPTISMTGGNFTVIATSTSTYHYAVALGNDGSIIRGEGVSAMAGASATATLTDISSDLSNATMKSYKYIHFSDGSDGGTSDPDTEEPTTPDTEEPETPDTEEPETPDTEEPETPDTEEPETPDTEEPETPDQSSSPESWFVFSSGTITGLQSTGLTATAIVIPSTIGGVAVTAISAAAFKNQTKLESLTILGGVKSIGDNGFYGCTALSALSLPDTITSIGYRAFYNCDFTEITFTEVSSSVISSISLDGSAFYYNIASKTVSINPTDNNKTAWTSACTTFNNVYSGDRGLVKLEMGDTTPETSSKVAVTGKILDSNGEPLEGVTVELIQTGKTMATATTNSEGQYSFTDITVGIYNLVATHTVDDETSTKTELVNLEVGGSLDDVKMPSEHVSSQVVIPATIPVVAVGNVDSVAEDEGENTGEKVTVTMEVTATIASGAKQEINGGLLDDETVGIWLDITLSKTVGEDSTSIPITETNSLLEIVFELTQDLQSYEGYAIYREHDGVVDKIYTTPNADGEYIQVQGEYLILYVKKFSVYALVVSENLITDPSIGGNPGGSTTPSTPEDDSSSDDSTSGDSSSGNSSSGNSSSGNSSSGNSSSGNSSSGNSSSGSSSSGSSSSGSSSSGSSSSEETESSPSTEEETTEATELPIYYNLTISTFSDIADSAIWYYDAVKYVYDRGLMTGTSANTFEPERMASRGMVVTILHKLAGNPSLSGVTFDDVLATAYYADAVAWASGVGVATGEENNKFNPDGAMTREELLLVLYRYTEIFGGNTTEIPTDLTFNDTADMSAWAKEAIAWSVDVGLVTGKNNNLFAPQDLANRGELAQILVKYVEFLNK